MKKIYISGPMRGKDGHNYEMFNLAEKTLLEQDPDAEILNPASSFGGDTSRSFSEYMRLDYQMLLDASEVVFLPGWQNSEGARLEYQMAKSLGLTLRPWDDTDTYLAEPMELEAARIVRNGERERKYGPPLQDFTRTAGMWTGLTGKAVTPEQVALQMVQLKLSRLIATPDHRDSLVDAVGYLICYSRIVLEGGKNG